MSAQYFCAIQPKSVTIHFMDGDAITVPDTHVNFSSIRDKALAQAPADEIKSLARLVENLKQELAPAMASGAVTVTRDGVLFRGKPIELSITKRIMEFVEQGLNVDPMVRFLEKLLDNPRRSSVLSLYDFMEKNEIPLHPDGDFIVYKKVRGDYMDIHSGTFSNAVGTKPTVAPWEVEESRDQTCAKGLHVCARHYLPSFGYGDDKRIVVCKVNPKDVVAVPFDYNNAKMRVSSYEVIGELESAAVAEILDGHLVLPSDGVDGVTLSDEAKAYQAELEAEMEAEAALEAELEAESEEEDYCDCGEYESDCTWPDCTCGDETEEPEAEEPEPDPAPEPTEPVKKRFGWFR